MKRSLYKTSTWFAILACALCVGCNRESHRPVVGIQPFGTDRHLADTVSSALIEVFDINVIVLPSQDIPEESFINIKTPRYRADKIIQLMKKEKPDTLDYILSITNKDISATKRDKSGNIREPKNKYEDWGVFGLGYQPGSTSIVSTYRLRDTNRSNFIARLKKVAVHELGHNFGLQHCDSPDCVMRDAVETIRTIDEVRLSLCSNCRRKL